MTEPDERAAGARVLPPAQPLLRATLVDRLTQAIATELDLIEQVTAGVEVSEPLRADSDRRTRTLATLVHTFAELTKVQIADEQRPDPHDDRPHDLDELRQRLFERLAQLVDERPSVPVVGDELAGNENGG